MKLKILTSFIGLSICTSVYGITEYPTGISSAISKSYVLDSPTEISLLPSNLGYDTQVVLKGAGDYSLSELDSYVNGVNFLIVDINDHESPNTYNDDGTVLMKDFGTKLTKAEVYRMLFGTELEPEKFGERPMSKLKRDLLEYLHIIEKG